MTSILTKLQFNAYGPRSDAKLVADYGALATMKVKVRYDDECGNGHNSFAITGEVRVGRRQTIVAVGCLHEDIARLFPDLAPVIKYHLMNSDEPMYYVANTMYWLGYSGFTDGKPGSPPNLQHARSTAVWPDMPASYVASADLPLEQLNALSASIEAELLARKPGLMAEFRAAVESLGFVY